MSVLAKWLTRKPPLTKHVQKKQKAQYINSVKVATEKMQRQNKASLAEITRQQSTSVMMKSRPTRILPIFYVTGPLTSEREIKLDVTEMNMLRRRNVGST